MTEEGNHTDHASHTPLVVGLHFLWLENTNFSGEVVYLLSLNSYFLKILSFSELHMGKISSNMYRTQEEEKLPTLKREQISDNNSRDPPVLTGSSGKKLSCIKQL